MYTIGYSTNKSFTGGLAVILGVPQSIGLTEATLGEVTVSWVDVPETVDGYKIYRRLTSVGGAWSLVGTVAEGAETYTDTTVVDNTQYDYKVVAYIGVNETTAENVGENYSEITTIEIVTGLLFEYDNTDFLLKDSDQSLTAPWSVKMGIQQLATGDSAVGLFGRNASTQFRVLSYVGSDFMRMNYPTLATSGTLNTIDLTSRNIIEVYCESGGDVYYKANPDATAEFLFNIGASPTLNLNTVMSCGGGGSRFITEGYLYYLEIDNNGTVETYNIDEGSGATITGSLGSTWTIQTSHVDGLTYINNTMWQSQLPSPPGFVEFVSLSVSGRNTEGVNDNLAATYTDYGVGTVERRIAEITGNSNPEGFTHALITTMTNDIGNTGNFLTDSQYETELTAAVQQLKAVGLTVIIAGIGTFDTAVKQAAKDYDSTIGAMLSGDPLNPTPESQWDFNTTNGGVTAVIPLYIAKANAVATAESVTFIDTFQWFIDGQTPFTYHDWIGADGTHYNTTGYEQYGACIADTLDGLGLTGTEKFVVLGDSLGNSQTAYISAAYNS